MPLMFLSHLSSSQTSQYCFWCWAPGLAQYRDLFNAIDRITVSIFIVEYVLRIWTADFFYQNETRLTAIWKYVKSTDGIIELLTILPFFFLNGMVVFRMLRVVRIFNLFRLNANYDSFSVIRTVIYDKRNQLLSSIFVIFIVMLASSLLMYNVENPVQPDAFTDAFSGI